MARHACSSGMNRHLLPFKAWVGLAGPAARVDHRHVRVCLPAGQIQGGIASSAAILWSNRQRHGCAVNVKYVGKCVW